MTNITLNEVGTIKRQLELAIEREFVDACEDVITFSVSGINDKFRLLSQYNMLERLSEIEHEQDLFITTETDGDKVYITVSK